MVSAWWLLVVFSLGVMAGITIIALCSINKE